MRRALLIAAALLAAPPATAAASTYSDTVTTTPGLVDYWRLGEAGGFSALPAVGTSVGGWGGSYALGAPGALAGDADTAAQLSGPSVLALDSAWAAAGDLTLEAWVAPTSTGTRYVISKGSTTTGFQLYVTGSRQPAFSVGTTGGTVSVTSPTALGSGTWHHLAATLAGQTLTLYVDGVPVATRVATGSVRRSSGLALDVGRYSQSSTGPFLGGLDEITLYDGALSGLQVAGHAAAGIDTATPDVTVAGPPARTDQTTAGFSLSSSKARVTFACSLDGAGFSGCAAPSYTGLATGAHTLRVQATDRWGLTGPAQTYAWIVDPTVAPDYSPLPPATTIAPRFSVPSSSTDASFVLSATKTGVTYACSLDNGAYKACVSGVSYSYLATGDHTLRVRSTDRFGQAETTPAAFTWSIDRTPPDTQALAVGAAPGAMQGSAVFTSTESSSRFECKVGGATDWSPCASPLAMPAGASAITVRAVDAAGNADASPATVKLGDAPDGTEPTGAAAFASAAAGLVFTATKGATLSCRLDHGAWKDCASPLAVDGLGWGQHAFAVRAAFSSGTVLESPDAPWTAAAPSPRIAALQFPVLLRRGRDGRARINGRTPALRFALNVTTGVRLTLSRVRHGRAVATVGAWSIAGRQGDVVAPVPDKLVRRLRRGRYQLVARAAGAPVVTRSFAVV